MSMNNYIFSPHNHPIYRLPPCLGLYVVSHALGLPLQPEGSLMIYWAYILPEHARVLAYDYSMNVWLYHSHRTGLGHPTHPRQLSAAAYKFPKVLLFLKAKKICFGKMPVSSFSLTYCFTYDMHGVIVWHWWWCAIIIPEAGKMWKYFNHILCLGSKALISIHVCMHCYTFSNKWNHAYALR